MFIKNQQLTEKKNNNKKYLLLPQDANFKLEARFVCVCVCLVCVWKFIQAFISRDCSFLNEYYKRRGTRYISLMESLKVNNV